MTEDLRGAASETERGGPSPPAASPIVPPPEPDYRELYLRAAAELDNYRKRSERERTALAQFAAEGVVRRLLDPYDSFDRAILELERLRQEAPEGLRPPLARTIEGLRALQRQFKDVLASEGVESIQPAGADFDPEVHEALVRVPSEEVPAGKVVEVLQTGYKIRGRLLRPARVAVSKGPQPAAAAVAADDAPAGAAGPAPAASEEGAPRAPSHDLDKTTAGPKAGKRSKHT